jgi:hypothetical protein
MWVQCDAPPEGGAFDVAREGGGFDEAPEGGVVEAPGGRVVDDPPGVSPGGDEELFDVGVVEDELLVAAFATAAPPPTRTVATATPASACRSRILICIHLLSSASGRACRPRFLVSTGHLRPVAGAWGPPFVRHPCGFGSRLSGSPPTLRRTPEKNLAAGWEPHEEPMAFL